jgi:hypothetical protein
MNSTQPVWVFVALGNKHPIRMRHIVLCGLTLSPTFSTFSRKLHDFRKTVTKNKICISIFSMTFI